MKRSYIAEKIPIIIVTGFLGAGKTSLLSALIRQPEFAKTALVVNEFGELGFDHDLIRASGCSEPVLLAGGCLCCAMKNDLGYTLRNLSLRVERKEISAFRRVVVETTGLANPAPILHSILGDSWITSRFQVTNVVTVVDLVNGLDTLKNHAEAVDQVIYADTLIMSKRDLVEDAQEMAVRAALARLNSHTIPTLREPKIDPNPFLARPRSSRLVVAPVSFVSGNEHIADVYSASIEVPGRPSWKDLACVLDSLSDRFFGHLLRVKGILEIADTEKLVAIHAVQRLFHPPELLDEWPAGEPDSRLVFISRGLPASEIAAEFAEKLSSQRLI